MPSLDNALGIHELALRLRSQRMEVLSSNLANADTPNYKARDIDFQAQLQQAAGRSTDGTALQRTHSGHLPSSDSSGAQTMYRNPMQPAIDGNTVDSHVEKGKFMENALQYQATLQFIDGRIQTLRKAIRGD